MVSYITTCFYLLNFNQLSLFRVIINTTASFCLALYPASLWNLLFTTCWYPSFLAMMIKSQSFLLRNMFLIAYPILVKSLNRTLKCHFDPTVQNLCSAWALRFGLPEFCGVPASINLGNEHDAGLLVPWRVCFSSCSLTRKYILCIIVFAKAARWRSG